jgi:hypothetical protein
VIRMEVGEVDDDDDDCISRGEEAKGRGRGNTQTRVRKERVATPVYPPVYRFPSTNSRLSPLRTHDPPQLATCTLCW